MLLVASTLAPLDQDTADRSNAICARAEDEVLLPCARMSTPISKLLRDSYTGGDPRRCAYFGERKINEDLPPTSDWSRRRPAERDDLLGDLRVATQCPAARWRPRDQPPSEPALHDCVFGKAKTFRGEAEILGVAYLTIYEPIFGGGGLIGILVWHSESALRADADAGKAIQHLKCDGSDQAR